MHVVQTPLTLHIMFSCCIYLQRDSKLTRLLEDALGGNTRTAIVACATPLPGFHLEQTRVTLEFAARAAHIVCSPQRNMVALEAPADSMQQVCILNRSTSEHGHMRIEF
jgi:hypothetical protein